MDFVNGPFIYLFACFCAKLGGTYTVHVLLVLENHASYEYKQNFIILLTTVDAVKYNCF
jgi:hypothetical protein